MPWLRKYIKTFEMGFQTALEYRLNFAISLISAAYPIFIQSFLWTAIFNSASGSEVYGYTYRQMIAYTFLAGLVARLVRTGFEYDILDDVKTGKFSKFLVQPLGYFPYRLANFFGQKLPGVAMILGILVFVLLGLNHFWGVSIEFSRVLLFLVTLVLAIALNFLIFYCISSVAFWIVEIGFLFEGLRIVIILLSGGIFPLEVFGARFVQVMNFLPFKYTVNYPINVLNGKIPFGEIGSGMVAQCIWIGLCLLAANYLWKIGSRRFIAVGG
ncbi:MAG TPA: ABC-2 family transporter protein [Anaerolineales bacterium]|nr:ABC-2 family transporter protein [Anaerolineales bacterium]